MFTQLSRISYGARMLVVTRCTFYFFAAVCVKDERGHKKNASHFLMGDVLTDSRTMVESHKYVSKTIPASEERHHQQPLPVS